MTVADLFGLWPVAMVLGVAAVRMVEHALLEEIRAGSGPLTIRDRFLVELLSAAGQAGIVAAGVGLGLLFGHRIGL